VDPANTPAYDTSSILPHRRGDLTLSWLTGSSCQQDFSLQIANPLERGKCLNIKSYYPQLMEPADNGIVTVTGSITNRQFDIDDMAAELSAAPFSAKANWRGASKVGSSGGWYQTWLEMPACQYTGGDPDALSNKRRFGASFDWFAAYDETAGYDAKFTIVCGVSGAGLETYV
jgi:hypothetical protein